MLFLVAPTKTRRIRNFTVQEAVNYVLEPNSDSELSDLYSVQLAGSTIATNFKETGAIFRNSNADVISSPPKL